MSLSMIIFASANLNALERCDRCDRYDRCDHCDRLREIEWPFNMMRHSPMVIRSKSPVCRMRPMNVPSSVLVAFSNVTSTTDAPSTAH